LSLAAHSDARILVRVHIAVFEPNPSGHRYTYVRRLLPALASLGQRLTFATSREGIASIQYRAQISGVERLCEIDADMSLGTGGRFQAGLRSFAENLHRVAVDLGADHVIVPYADGMIQVVGLRRLMGRFRLPGGVEIEALMMRGAFAYAEPGIRETARARTWLSLTQAAPFAVVHHIDPIVVSELAERAPALARRVRLIPDPSEQVDFMTRTEARRTLGLPEDGRYIGCVGSMNRRKGIDLLVRAFVAASVARNDRLLLAGPVGPAVAALLAGMAADAVRGGRIVVLDRYLSESEFRVAIAAMDVVGAPYPPDSGSSSIVIHAAGQERPVLGSDAGWVGWTVRRFGLGTTCDTRNTEAFANAVSGSLDASVDFRSSEGGRRFVAFHRPENFAACFTRRIRARLGMPAQVGLPTWDWVLEAARDSDRPASRA
jgi:glycosyltransferase involved in cell wall biosynthesis